MDPTTTEPPEEWHALPPAAGLVRGIGGAISGLILGTPAIVVALQPLDGFASRVLLLVGGVLATTAAGAWLGRARWRRTRWMLDTRGLHLRRGVLWRTEVLVPRSRVQHLDIERGPLERHFGLATLVVHTAGSQTHALRQSGLAEPDAVSLRDALIPEVARDDDAL